MKSELTVPCQKRCLKEIRQFVKNWLAQYNIQGGLAYQMTLAVDEACANAIIHGNDCDGHKELCVQMSYSNKNVNIEIFDIGEQLPELPKTGAIDWDSYIKTQKKGGFGLKIMFRFMDQVQYFRRGNQQVCSLTKMI